MSALETGVLVFVLMSVVAFALHQAAFGERRVLAARLSRLAAQVSHGRGALPAPAGAGPGRLLALFNWLVRLMPAPERKTAKGEKLAQLLAQAGFHKSQALRVLEAVRAGSALGGAFVGLVAAFVMGAHGAESVMCAVGGAGMGAFAPSYLLGRRARKRKGAIGAQVSDVLDLLIVCVEAGLGLLEAMKVVSHEAERHGQAIGQELSLAVAEVSAGASLGDSLRKLAERTGVDDLKPLAATLIQSEELGAQMAPALRAMSDALRSRRRLRAEEAAQRTTIKILFPLVLLVLPAMLIVILGPAIVQAVRTLTQ